MKALTGEDRMPFGKEAGQKLEKVSPDYLLWFYEDKKELDQKGKLFGTWKALFDYIHTNKDAIIERMVEEETRRKTLSALTKDRNRRI